MSMSDPIADMLTRIRNAQARHFPEVTVGATRVKLALAEVLKEEGYLENCQITQVDGRDNLVLNLKYYRGRPVIEMIRRISRPGLRVYRGKHDLPRVMGGMGIAIVSTSRGIMSDRKARQLGEGGEVLCYVS